MASASPTRSAATGTHRAFDKSAAGLLSLGVMATSSGVTVIDEKALRGVLAPPTVISKALLEDLVDFIELSSPRVVKALEARKADADRKRSWLTAEDVQRRVNTRRRLPK